MDETKKPWQSRAMWAGVVALLALNFKSFGFIDVSAEDQSTLTDVIVSVIQNGAVIVTMAGRYIAKSRITL